MAVKQKGEVYRCKICGNEVKVITVGGGTLVCCNKQMELIREGEPVEEEDIEEEEAEEEENWGGFDEDKGDESVEEEINKGFAG